jgi:TolB-like protein
MASLLPGFEYDIFISYRQKDNKYDRWISEFVENLKRELEATFKDDVSVYFDINPSDGLLETHDVSASLKEKLKCLIFIPVISQTYCDPNSFAWTYEFCAFNKLAKEDQLGRDIRLTGGNIASRILPIRIHDLDPEDKKLVENEFGGILRAIDFIYKEPGVNRPLKPTDNKNDNLNKTDYRNQVNKVANAILALITAIKLQNNKPVGGNVKDSPKKPSGLPSISKNTVIVAIITVVLVIISLFLYFRKDSGNKMSETKKRSIAVLYFNNMSGDPQQEYFCDGVTEEIITRLSMIKGLKVTSRTSVYQYKNEKKTARQIARELGVTNILEGSFRKDGDKIRITAQLINAATDDYSWSQTYNRKLKDIFEVQSDIAQNIASRFSFQLSKQEKKDILSSPTRNTQAYDKYLMASSIAYADWAIGTEPVNLLKSNSLLRQAIQLDPKFIYAYDMLSWNYSAYSAFAEDPQHWLDSAKILAKEVILETPDKAAGYNSLANAYWKEGNSEEALKWQLKSDELEPFKSAGNISRFYCSLNNYGKAMEWLLKAIEQDPSDYQNYISKAEIFYNLDLLDSMKISLEKARSISPETYAGESWVVNYDLMTGNYEEYEYHSRSMFADISTEYQYQLAMFYLVQKSWKKADSLYALSNHPDDIDAGLVKIRLGDKALGSKFLNSGIERRMYFKNYNGPWNMYDISRAYAALGNNQYILYFKIATDQKGWHVLSWFRRDPFFDLVRDTPEFKKLSHQIEEKNDRYKADLVDAMNRFYQNK